MPTSFDPPVIKAIEWPERIDPNDDFQQAYQLIEEGTPFLYITGKAGTGKSTLIQCLKSMIQKPYAVVAPTGVAALNAGGQTIHSFFRFRPGPLVLKDIKPLRHRAVYKNLQLLFIDEISMVRADMLDAIEHFLHLNGPHPHLPFGGVQIVAVGDLFQLPPIISDPEEMRMFAEEYETEYFFSAHCLRQEPLVAIELKTIYRQKENAFIHLLNHIREGTELEQVVEDLNIACCDDDPFPNAITLCSTNAIADQINTEQMQKLPGTSHRYLGELSGDFSLNRNLPSPTELELKVNAQVMMTRNDPDKRWVNGTLGIIKALGNKQITVEIISEEKPVRIDVTRTSWESVRYAFDEKARQMKTEVIGAYKQFPLIPAWAITIHKSQGKTLDRVKIHLGAKAFADGQVYVALSRCRSLENVRLLRPLRVDEIRINRRAKQFNNRLFNKGSIDNEFDSPAWD